MKGIQIIPNIDVSNDSLEKFWNSIHKIYTPYTKKLLESKNITSIIPSLFSSNSISFEFFADYNEISFNIFSLTELKNYIKSQVESTWQNCSVKEINDYVTFDKERTACGIVSLKHHNMFSLKIDNKMQSLKQILFPMNQLEEDEKMLLQVILKPIDDSWRRNSLKLYKDFKESGKQPTRNNVIIVITVIIEYIIKLICSIIDSLISTITNSKNSSMLEIFEQKEIPSKIIKSTRNIPTKLLKHGFETDIRVIIQSDNIINAENKLTEFEGILKELEDENELIITKPILKNKFINYVKERKTPLIKINSNILSVPEISQFCRLPESEVDFEKIKRNGIRNTQIPKELTKGSLILGTYINNKGEEKQIYWDSKDDDTLMKTLLIVSDPGGGKTELSIDYCIQVAEKNLGSFCFIDPADGIAGIKLVSRLPEDKLDNLVILNFNDLNKPIGLNLIRPSNAGRFEYQIMTKMWTEFFVKYCNIDNHWSSRNILRKASAVVFSDPENTLLEVKLMIENKEFRKMQTERIKNNKKMQHLVKWWSKFDSMPFKVQQETVKPILNKLDIMLDDERIKNIICQRNSKMPNLSELLDSKKYIIILISEGVFGYESAQLLTALIWMNIWITVLAREKIKDENKRMPLFLVADEPQNYIGSAGTTKQMIAKSRKYKLKPIFTFQSIKQIVDKDKKLLRTLLDMAPHILLGKNSKKTFDEFKEEITPLKIEDGLCLPAYHWIAKLYHEKNPITPFIFKANNIKETLRNCEEIIEKQTLLYSRDAEEVEEDIFNRENFDLIEENEEEVFEIGKAETPKIYWGDLSE